MLRQWQTFKHILAVTGHKLMAAVGVCLGLFVLLLVFGLPEALLTKLAGGRGGGLSMFFFFWPVAAFVALLTIVSDNVCRIRNTNHRLEGWQFWRPGWLTAVWLVFYFLPIICNGAATLLRLLSCQSASEFVFRYRWESRPAMFLTGMATLAIVVIIGELCNRKQRQSPPPWKPHDHVDELV